MAGAVGRKRLKPFLPSHGLCISSSKKSQHQTRQGVLKIVVRERRIFFFCFMTGQNLKKKNVAFSFPEYLRAVVSL